MPRSRTWSGKPCLRTPHPWTTSPPLGDTPGMQRIAPLPPTHPPCRTTHRTLEAHCKTRRATRRPPCHYISYHQFLRPALSFSETRNKRAWTGHTHFVPHTVDRNRALSEETAKQQLRIANQKCSSEAMEKCPLALAEGRHRVVHAVLARSMPCPATCSPAPRSAPPPTACPLAAGFTPPLALAPPRTR